MWPCLKDAGFKEITMMLPNPSSSNEVFVFAEDEYALLSIRHGMFVMLRATMKFNIMDVQIHQIFTSSTGQRLSALNGLRFAKHASAES